MNLHIKKSEFLQRSKGIGFLSYKTIDNTTKLNDLFQQGSLKIRFPSSFNEFSEAVLINTAGGYTGGDYCKLKIEVDKDSKVLISGQAAEKVYKCIDGKVKIINQIYLGEKSKFLWLPQELIMFNESRIKRCNTINLSQSSMFFGVESVVFGRHKMGEKVYEGMFDERWKIILNNKLIFSDFSFIDGDINQKIKNPAILDGSNSMSSIIFYKNNMGNLLDKIRNSIVDLPCETGVSMILNNLMVFRLVSKNSRILKEAISKIFYLIFPDLELPKTWRI